MPDSRVLRSPRGSPRDKHLKNDQWTSYSIFYMIKAREKN